MRESPISRYRGHACGRYVLRGRLPSVYVSDVVRDLRSGMAESTVAERHGITRGELQVIWDWWVGAYGMELLQRGWAKLR